MPLPQLASRALYRVSSLPDVLLGLGTPNTAAGYAEVQSAVEKQTNRSVNNRSVQLMLYQGQYLKYEKCLAIQTNVIAYANLRNIADVPLSIIDEHEYYIPRLQNIMEQVAAYKKCSLYAVQSELANATGFSVEFIDAMMKYRRCMREEAKLVRDKLVELAPAVLIAGRARDGKVSVAEKTGVTVDNDLLTNREAQPIPWAIRRLQANDD
jgi:hypothetical protein